MNEKKKSRKKGKKKGEKSKTAIRSKKKQERWLVNSCLLTRKWVSLQKQNSHL